ncbi:FAD-dependent oxidoreductase [Amycolatopsis sp.]|uniref:FAD-dependent oxidoreductase n=1 Tax=Amycolatopsis sp. TaxID=37632 RepID=UPI002BC151A2|nr:FAD-dependent oxidoreductase [Amycolatopsis sp.]HVV09811.1 FAD-dependent oxidoreductase [Amycolatopsis sp.]
MATVTVVGGGYGGVAAAKQLDKVADVVLVEPRDTFVHTVAALRALVDPQWTDRIFLPYDGLLTAGRVVRDRALAADADSVTLASGEVLGTDYLVLASGSSYPFPAKIDVFDSAAAKAKIRATHDALTRAESVLLLGAGPAGLELAGEIKAAWPEKAVTVVDPAEDILAGAYPDEFRTELRDQLAALGVEALTGAGLAEHPPSEPGEAKSFTVRTTQGREVTADIWFRCYGVSPVSDYLAGPLASARRPNGQVEVTDELRLPGQERVFALGDLTAIAEPKMAKAAGEHAVVVADNIATLIAGGTELRTYRPGPPGISLPLGPSGGASYSAEHGIFGPEQTSQLKGADLRIALYRELFGLPA